MIPLSFKIPLCCTTTITPKILADCMNQKKYKNNLFGKKCHFKTVVDLTVDNIFRIFTFWACGRPFFGDALPHFVLIYGSSFKRLFNKIGEWPGNVELYLDL